MAQTVGAQISASYKKLLPRIPRNKRKYPQGTTEFPILIQTLLSSYQITSILWNKLKALASLSIHVISSSFHPFLHLRLFFCVSDLCGLYTCLLLFAEKSASWRKQVSHPVWNVSTEKNLIFDSKEQLSSCKENEDIALWQEDVQKYQTAQSPTFSLWQIWHLCALLAWTDKLLSIFH